MKPRAHVFPRREAWEGTSLIGNFPGAVYGNEFYYLSKLEQ